MLRRRASYGRNRAFGPSTGPSDGPHGAMQQRKEKTFSHGDTKTQSANTFGKIEALLKEQGLGMGDVVMMHVYLVGDPANGGKMDFAGLNAAYGQFFGTKEQPNKPARSAVQVAALAIQGPLVEIEVIAAKSK